MPNRKLRLLALAVLLPVSALVLLPAGCTTGTRPALAASADGYLLCFWNVENFFDDRDDHRKGPGDRDYDPWFARDPEALRLKLDHLSDALVKMNDGRGPDIIALVEVESVRAAELLQGALNNALKKKGADETLQYQNVLIKELTVGRHIAPAVITRLPVVRDRTRLLGRRLRILETRIVVSGKELVLVASHWTSRLRKGKEVMRDKYGDQIYGTFRGMYKQNPRVAFLVCGDFNDTPDDESVTQHLRAVGDRAAVLNAGDTPLLYNLLAGKDPRDYGTIYDRGKWSIFDQIAVSRGMLDGAGWTCDPDSLQVVKETVRPGDRLGRPWRFGSKRDQHPRGYSDHFPVTVRLRVHPE